MASSEEQAVVEALLDLMREHGEAFAERYLTDALEPETMARLSLELWAVGLLLLDAALERRSSPATAELTPENLLSALLAKFGSEATLFVRLREASYRLPAGPSRDAIDAALALGEGPLNALGTEFAALAASLPATLPSLDLDCEAIAERFATCLSSQGFSAPMARAAFLDELADLMGYYLRDFESALMDIGREGEFEPEESASPLSKRILIGAAIGLLLVGVGAGILWAPSLQRPGAPSATEKPRGQALLPSGLAMTKAIAQLKAKGWDEVREASGIPNVPYDSALGSEGNAEADGQAFPALLFTRMTADDGAPQEVVVFLTGHPGGFEVLDVVEQPPPSLLNYFYRTTMGREKEDVLQEALHFVGAGAVRDKERYDLVRENGQDTLVAASGERWPVKHVGTPPDGEFEEIFLSADGTRLAILWMDEAAGIPNLVKFTRTPEGAYQEAPEESDEGQ